MKQQFNFIEGLSYIPIARGSKSPTMKGWNLRENCITDKAQAYKLSSGNVGLAHAYCSPITCALDIDHLPSAVDWFAAKSIDLELELERSGAAIAESGREHSLKAFYRLPESAGVLPSKIVTTNNKVAFEFRCGTNEGKTVCDVIPPSIHPAGTNYRWLRNDLSSLAEIPRSLLTSWLQLIEQDRKNKIPALTTFDPGVESPRRVALLREQLRFINPDCDYETWRDVIFSILSSEYSCAENIAHEWSKRALDRYDYAALVSLIGSYKPGLFTLGTVYHYARIGGYDA
jgi:hypothetical protein